MTKTNKRNRNITILALSAAAVASTAVGACLLPDQDIRFVDNDCGEVWGVQAIGAYAYDANVPPQQRDIKDETASGSRSATATAPPQQQKPTLPVANSTTT